MKAHSNAAGAMVYSRWRRRAILLFLMAIVVISVVVAVSMGALDLPLRNTLAILLKPFGVSLPWDTDDAQSAIVWRIRMPRVALALLVGAVLSVAGAIMQGVFRNPLADPGLIGVSSGAALAAATMIVFGASLLTALPSPVEQLALPLAAFMGGIVCTYLVYGVSLVGGRLVISTMLLAGIAFNSLGFAALGLLQYAADENELRGLTFWMLGSLGGATWSSVAAITPFLILPLIGSIWLIHPLNCFLLGEAEAMHLGVSVQRMSRLAIFLVALGVGATVAVSGMIAFLGLVVPHLIRLAVSPDHRIVIPGSALLGAALLVTADTLARVVVPPSELPVGVVTTMMGAPFFLLLLIKSRKQV